MGLETPTYLNDLNVSWPLSGDDQIEGDDHIRGVKTALKNTFPGMAGRAWRVQVKSSGYTIAATDNMSIIRCTAALTLAVTAAATLGDGFLVMIEAAGGDVIVDPNASEPVNGVATVTIPNGYNGLLRCDASAFTVLGLLPLAAGSARSLLDVYSKSEVYTVAGADAAIAAAIVAAVNLAIPPGTMVSYMGGSVQTGFLLCDGSNVSRTTYAALFAKIGTTWGVGDGSTTFGLPDSRRRVTVGSGGTGTGTLGNAAGNIGGAETHTLSTAELAVHSHSYSNIHAAGSWTAPGAGGSFGVGVSGNAGSGSAHNNMQPSMVATQMIRTGL